MRKFSLTEQIVSISALITAVVAVVIGVFELQTTREHQKLSVEPYLDMSTSNRNGHEFFLTNAGVGPARIKGVIVTVDGALVNDWDEVYEKITGNKPKFLSQGGLWNGLQLKAGEIRTVLQLPPSEDAKTIHGNSRKIDIKICYCSIYKDCWVMAKEVIPVPHCPADLTKGFPRAS